MKPVAGVAVAALSALVVGASAKADVISYQRAPVANIVSQLDTRYHIHIVVRGPLANVPNHLVSFTVGTTDQPTDRMQAVGAFANAMNMSFLKGFVIDKLPPDETVPKVPIDTSGMVVFQSKTVPVRQAIATVAGTDDATSQVADGVTGTITFTDTTLKSTEAAQEIADQTHTVWRVYYAIEPQAMLAAGPQPNLYFDTNPPAATNDDTANNTANSGNGTNNQTNPQGNGAYPYVSPLTNPYMSAAANGMSPYGYGYGASPYGYGYGASPYGYGASPYGYGGYPYGYMGSPYGTVGVMPSYGGYGPFGGYGGPPVSFP